MPTLKCSRCGRMTNTALSDWIDNIGIKDVTIGMATRCFAAWDEDKQCWVEGCAINDKNADKFSVKFAKKYIKL